jgi:hypothetical protein
MSSSLLQLLGALLGTAVLGAWFGDSQHGHPAIVSHLTEGEAKDLLHWLSACGCRRYTSAGSPTDGFAVCFMR